MYINNTMVAASSSPVDSALKRTTFNNDTPLQSAISTFEPVTHTRDSLSDLDEKGQHSKTDVSPTEFPRVLCSPGVDSEDDNDDDDDKSPDLDSRERILRDRQITDKIWDLATIKLMLREYEATAEPVQPQPLAPIGVFHTSFSPPQPNTSGIQGDVTWCSFTQMPAACTCVRRLHRRCFLPAMKACRYVPYNTVTEINDVEVGFDRLTEVEAFEAWRQAGWSTLPYNNTLRIDVSWTERTKREGRKVQHVTHSAPRLVAGETWAENRRYRRYVASQGGLV